MGDGSRADGLNGDASRLRDAAVVCGDPPEHLQSL